VVFNDEGKKSKKPWESQIYETGQEAGNSRVARRKKRMKVTLFNKLLVILLTIIILTPIFGYFYLQHAKSGSATKVSNTKSSVLSKKSIGKSFSTEKSIISSTSARKIESSTKNEETVSSNSATTTPAGQKTITVLEGEGLQHVASRSGVSVEELARLNGITLRPDGSFYPAINPGQELKVD
jgi:LysM repeat protein